MNIKTSSLLCAVAIVLASCTQDYTCTCTYPGLEDQVTSYEGLNSEERDVAEAACEALDQVAQISGGGCTWD